MASYRDDREALRQRTQSLEEELRGQEAEISEQQAELVQLREQVEQLRRSEGRSKPTLGPEPSPSKPRAKRGKVATGFLAAGILAAASLPILFQLQGTYCRARVYVSDPRIASAEFVVTGPDGFEERCTGKVCDFKLPPGTYLVRAQAGEHRGEKTLVARGNHSLATPIQLTAPK